MSQTDKLDVLLKELKDPYAQENWYRLKLYLDRLEVNGAGTGAQGPQGPVGPPGPQGPQGDSFWEQLTSSISASTTSIVDTEPLASFCQIEYFINYSDTVTNRKRSLKCTVLNDDSNIREQVYAISGAPLDIDLNTFVNGSDYELRITNNEANVVDVFITKTVLT